MTSAGTGPILYVEDEENDVFLLQTAFRRAGVQWPLAIAEDGQAAVEYVAARGTPATSGAELPRLVLLDLNLPRLSGLEVLCYIRSMDTWRGVPVCMFTSSNQQGDRDRALAAGATDYIVKPARLEALVAVAQDIRQRWIA